ncbi:MAG: putative binding protein precursor [Syntrophorhabdaceae bacterium PtaU1.Bin034]|nr:MAG: putative binding protein precursor [Syntrophorhabdaceae bacterium PtaU1.Bin034]
MTRIGRLTALVFFVLAIIGPAQAKEKLMVFCGAGFKMPMEEVITAFTKQSGTAIDVSYGSVGTVLSQVSFSRQGDVVVVPSPDTMEKARAKGHIAPGSTRDLGYVVPSINVQKGNPKGIRTLADMARPGIRVAIANPETVFVGMLAVEIVDKSLSPQEKSAFKKNIATYAEDFGKMASYLILKQVDAVIGFSSMSGWYPDKIDTVKLASTEIQRIGVGQAALLSYTKNRPAADQFLGFLNSPQAQDIFRKYHYFGTLAEATAWIGAKKPVGGEYRIPADWIGK